MTVIGFLTYADFISELNQEIQPKPLRLQAYSHNRSVGDRPLKQYILIVELSTENLDDDILICRFITADIWEPLPLEQKRLTRLVYRNDHAADLLRHDLVNRGFHTAPGLIQIKDNITIETDWPDCWDNLQTIEAN